MRRSNEGIPEKSRLAAEARVRELEAELARRDEEG